MGGLPSWNNKLEKPDKSREDYILEQVKDKFKQKVRKLESLDCTLELSCPLVVKCKDKLLLYALSMEQRQLSTEKEGQVKIE